MAQRKRGRFSYDEPDPDDGHREKKVRFPKGKKESQRSGRVLNAIFEGEEVDTAIKDTDPRVAATERAVRRSGALDRHDETSIPADVYGAEEEYQDSDEEAEAEISLEPFNLKQEREEGYFDADGNYVEYLNENVKDAWLDSAEVDTTLAAKHLKRYAEEEIEQSLSSKDLAAIKRRIADALQPGETVLKALRRLKSTSTEKDRRLKAKMSSLTKEAFDMLTEDAMKLLDHGEYNVYNEEKETFEREAEGYESLEKAKLHVSSLKSYGEGTSGSALGSAVDISPISEPEQLNGTAKRTNFTNDTSSIQASGNSTELDMFADDDNEVPGNSNSNQGEDHSGDSGYVYDETSGGGNGCLRFSAEERAGGATILVIKACFLRLSANSSCGCDFYARESGCTFFGSGGRWRLSFQARVISHGGHLTGAQEFRHARAGNPTSSTYGGRLTRGWGVHRRIAASGTHRVV